MKLLSVVNDVSIMRKNTTSRILREDTKEEQAMRGIVPKNHSAEKSDLRNKKKKLKSNSKTIENEKINLSIWRKISLKSTETKEKKDDVNKTSKNLRDRLIHKLFHN